MKEILLLLSFAWICSAHQPEDLNYTKPPVMDTNSEYRMFVDNVAKLIDYVYTYGLHCVLVRPHKRQDSSWIYSHYEDTITKKIPKRRCIVNLHLYTSEEVHITKDSYYEIIGRYWESLNDKNRWQGKLKRRPDIHQFEMVI